MRRQLGCTLHRPPQLLLRRLGVTPAPAAAAAQSQRRSMATKVSALSLTSKKRHGRRITMVTAYDFPSAVHVARAGMDVVLVGDSVAMVELGHGTTQPIGMDDMIGHSAAVQRGLAFAAATAAEAATATHNDSNDSKNSSVVAPLLVADMPFGSYEFHDTDIALRNAYRFIKEGGADAVKLEGGSPTRCLTIERIVQGGVAVMGHIGLTPQAISVIGGFRAQGRTAQKARDLVDQAMRLQDAGVFAIVLECVPHNVAQAITDTVEVPTIGIGAGGGTSGQVLVFHDMLGMLSHPHHEQFVPKFCKKYATIGHTIQEALQQYKQDVESGEFPGTDYSPYVMKADEKEAFDKLLSRDVQEREEKLRAAERAYLQTDEYETLSLYGDLTAAPGLSPPKSK